MHSMRIGIAAVMILMVLATRVANGASQEDYWR